MPSPPRTPGRGSLSPRRLFRLALGATVAVKVALAAVFPVVGDEAYLFTWAREPSWGYYDHPPLAAWLLHPLFAAGLGGSLLALRLPSVLLHAALAGVLVRWLRKASTPPVAPDAEERAYLAGTLFLLVPVHVLGVLMLTDVPLIACTFLAGAALFRADLQTPSGGDGTVRRPVGLGAYAAAGALLGLALLTKYLAALLAAAFLVWFLAAEKTRRRTAGLGVLVLCALPFVAGHLAWNAAHCWSTVAFNLYSRHAGESKNYSVARNLLFYAGTHLYLATPPVLWYLGRRWRRLAALAREPGSRVALLGFLVPMALLALSAALLLFGAYWVLPFYPFLFFLLPRVLERRELERSVRVMAAFTGVQAAALAVALALPLDIWRGSGFYPSLVTMARTGELVERLESVRGPETRLAARGYSLASILSWRSGEPVAVWGEGSHYARQDDLWTDYRAFAGGDVLLVDKKPVPPAVFDPYFRAVERRELPLHGATLHLALGRGFDYPRYRREVLARVRERYYDLPAWLPVAGCPFRERYFSQPAIGSVERTTCMPAAAKRAKASSAGAVKSTAPGITTGEVQSSSR
jgi:hypothetical protein